MMAALARQHFEQPAGRQRALKRCQSAVDRELLADDERGRPD
jgi:hypothetical protein